MQWSLRGASLVVLLSLRTLLFPQDSPVMVKSEPIEPVPLDLKLDQKRVRLGEQLFNDVRLSSAKSHSCATCHPLDRGGVDGQQVATRPNGTPHLRNTLTVFNVAFNSSFNWDGIADTLERHTEIVLTSPGLMNITWPELLSRLEADGAYVTAFRSAYARGIERNNVLDAIATYERSLLTSNSRFDRYLRGKQEALTPREKEGYRLFKAYGCISCHQGVNIGGNLYQKFGVFEDMAPVAQQPIVDLGRVRVTKAPRDRLVFRVPSLRNVAVTGPYFHDGRETNLEGAVETMIKAQLGREPSVNEIGEIVAFLNTLTGEYKGEQLKAANAEALENG